MDRSRKQSREGRETTIQFKSRNEVVLVDELIEDQLAQLVSLVETLKQSPEGNGELQRRIKSFGECKRSDDETAAEFTAKLHHWLHREISQTKTPLHPPRQILSDRNNAD